MIDYIACTVPVTDEVLGKVPFRHHRNKDESPVCSRESIVNDTIIETVYKQSFPNKGLKWLLSNIYKSHIDGLAHSHEQKASLKGSLHKYFNDGRHNFNQFSFEQFNTSIERLSSERGLNPSTARLHNFEFGLNIDLNCDANYLISLIKNYAYGSKRITDVQSFYDNDGMYLLMKRSHHILKIYAKGYQYSKEYNTSSSLLRVEIKTTNKKYFNKLGISHLSDLQNKETWKGLHELLINAVKKLVIYKPSTTPLTRPKQIEIRERLDNRQYYESLDYTQRPRLKAQIEKYNSKSHVKAELIELLTNEFNVLIGGKNIDEVNSEYIADSFQNQNNVSFDKNNGFLERTVTLSATPSPHYFTNTLESRYLQKIYTCKSSPAKNRTWI